MMTKREKTIQEYDTKRILKTSTYLGSLLLMAVLPMMSAIDSASGQNTELTEEKNIKAARQVIDAFNTGDLSN
ncbi:MAG: hypothetical protein ACRD5B_11965, partial [Nitrososphaeraceae archaeon]